MLAEKNAFVLGRPIELGEHLGTELLVEAGSLKAENVEPDRVAPARQRPELRLPEQLAADPLVAQRLRNPELPDKEPASVGFAHKAGDNAILITDEDASSCQG